MVASADSNSAVNPVVKKAKDQANHLRSILKEIAPQLTHSIALDVIAKLNGAKNWHAFLALQASSIENYLPRSATSSVIADQKTEIVQLKKRETMCGFCHTPVEINFSSETKLIFRRYPPFELVDFEGVPPTGLKGTVIRPYFSDYLKDTKDGVDKGMIVCAQCQPAADEEILAVQDKYTCACPGCNSKLITPKNLDNISSYGRLKIANYGDPLPDKFGYTKDQDRFCSKDCWDNYTVLWYEKNAAIIAEDANLMAWADVNPKPLFPPLFRLEEYTDDVALVMVIKSLPKDLSRELYEGLQELLVRSSWIPRRNQQGVIKWGCHPIPDSLNCYSSRNGSKDFYLPLPLQVYDYFRRQAGMSAVIKSDYEYDGPIWGIDDEPAKKLDYWG